MAESRPEYVVGMVCRRRLSPSPALIHMTPGKYGHALSVNIYKYAVLLLVGVRDSTAGDTLGQQYISAVAAIGERHTDIIIVGRGIYSV